jgi:hypothetical protein
VEGTDGKAPNADKAFAIGDGRSVVTNFFGDPVLIFLKPK